MNQKKKCCQYETWKCDIFKKLVAKFMEDDKDTEFQNSRIVFKSYSLLTNTKFTFIFSNPISKAEAWF